MESVRERKEESEAVISQLMRINPLMGLVMAAVAAGAALILCLILGEAFGFSWESLAVVYLMIKIMKTDMNLIKAGI